MATSTGVRGIALRNRLEVPDIGEAGRAGDAAVDLADDDDTWYHRAIAPSDRATDERGNLAFWSKRLTVEARGFWFAEISGRLVSLAKDLIADANAAAKQRDDAFQAEDPNYKRKSGFFGIRSARVATIRLIKGGALDVVSDGDKDDPAHAELVIRDRSMVNGTVIEQSLLLDLAERLPFVEADHPSVAQLDAACGRPV